MPLSQAQKDIINRRVPKGPCPVCGGRNRGVENGIFVALEVENSELQINTGRPFIIYGCQDCGHANFHLASVLGLLE
jgi:hypothetical protein